MSARVQAGPMNRPWRRMWAYFYYLRKPIVNFLPLLGLLLIVLLAGSYCFHAYYKQEEFAREPMGYVEALYITWSLVFKEHLMDFPDHWLLQVFYFALPPLGLVVILDGIVRFSYHILRRDESSVEWVQAMSKTMNNHVILCGLGKVGLRVMQQLIRLGEQVAVLEKDEHCPNLSHARKHGVPVRIGHSRDEGIFNDLNVAAAKSIILATDDDLANIELALDARAINPEIRVVLRLFDQELASKIQESFNIHHAFSTSELAAPLFATGSSDKSIINSFYVGSELLVVAQLVIRPESELMNLPIREFGSRHKAFVISHTRCEQMTSFPSAETILKVGDQVTIQTKPEVLKTIHKLNRDPLPY